MNELMRDFIISYDLYEVVKNVELNDWQKLRSSLPKELSALLDLPVIKDAGGNYFLATKDKLELVDANEKIEDYSRWYDQTGYETDQNKINLLDYTPEDLSEAYDKDLEAWSEAFLTNGLYFSLLLHRKLAAFMEGAFRVFLFFSISRYANCSIVFYFKRPNQAYFEGFETKPIASGILTID